MKAETRPQIKKQRRALWQLAAGMRWTVRSWLRPADREARWEQRQHGGCPGEKR